MNTLDYKATPATPEIYYGGDDKLLIKGRSMPEDVKIFYQPLLDWAGSIQISTLSVDMNLEYMNSSSSKKLIYVLKILDANNNIKKLTINWYYEEGDEEALESGMIFEERLLKAEFRYHEIKEVA
ncbi:MAG TPA: DUF1987 domain-containing protein [Bacteroidales bacterium]|nr:DUF1987 domain-containing protein [Bacteroidales bacterium]